MVPSDFFLSTNYDCSVETTVIVKFPDNTQLCKAIESARDRDILQRTLDNLRVVKHVGNEIQPRKIKGDAHWQQEPALYLLLRPWKLKNCQLQTKKRMLRSMLTLHLSLEITGRKHLKKLQVLRQITRNFNYRDKKVFLKLYCTNNISDPILNLRHLHGHHGSRERYIDIGKGTIESSPTDYQPEEQHL
jgi:hypothetical protein